jgi:TPR repeat protein
MNPIASPVRRAGADRPRRFTFAQFALGLAACLVATGPFALPASAQDFRRGLQLYNLGDYSAAWREWQPLAERGDADAQAGLGYLYFKGLGVRQSYALAADWYARSAEQGQPGAQFFLGSMYFYGDGVQRDFVQAYAWCELAQANGEPEALECRLAAERRLTTAQVRESLQLVTAWYRRHPAATPR